MNFKKWMIPKVDKKLAIELADECDTDPLVALIAISRGYTEAYELEEFLSDEPILSEPFELPDMERATMRISEAVSKNEKIAVYGDYDCDGITAAAIVYDYLDSIGAEVCFVIPDRIEDGYGMNKAQLNRLAKSGVKLVVTVDNGINSIAEIEEADALEMDVVVTDHHLPLGELPKAAAIVNPHLSQGEMFKKISGVAVAFKLVCALDRSDPLEMLERYADIVTIGTIADVMPLCNENRSIVKAGLKMLNSEPRAGLKALIEVSALQDKRITAGNIAFVIAPRINASGRMGSAESAVKLLLEKDYDKAILMARGLDELNIERQKTEQEIAEAAADIIEKKGYNYDRVIVVCGEHWHHGVIGIAASRIMEKYGRPCIILSSDGETACGSGRSLPGFSLFDAISSAKDLTEKFGGHKLAAGLSLKTELVDEFRRRINEYAKNFKMPFQTINIDCKLKPQALSLQIPCALKALEPFGVGNPAPVFGLFGMKLQKITPVGAGKHLRLTFSKENAQINAMLFGCDENQFPFAVGDTVELAVSLDVNTYQGNESLSIIIKDMKKGGLAEEEMENSIRDFEAFKRGDWEILNCETITPTRAEIGAMYRLICAADINEERFINKFLDKYSYSKIKIAIAVMLEMNVVILENGILSSRQVEEKADVMNTQTMKILMSKVGGEK